MGLSIFIINTIFAQDSTKIEMLEKRIMDIEQKLEQSELEKLKKEAESF